MTAQEEGEKKIDEWNKAFEKAMKTHFENLVNKTNVSQGKISNGYLDIINTSPKNQPMTPKEKAKELYNKYSVYNVNGKSIMKIGPEVKVFTLIAVDEQIELLLNLSPHMAFPEHIKYLQQVKQEIEKL